MAKLILLRHGQSQWNLENRYTGWVDVPLSDKGRQEAAEAGRKFANIQIDIAYTTPLQRANRTFVLAWEASGKKEYPIFQHMKDKMKDWAHFTSEEKNYIEVVICQDFNERYYGDLQGLNKAESVKTFGEEQIRLWRRSYDVPPPNGESLKDTLERVLPAFKETVEKDLRAGRNVIITAHGNSLRAISKYIEGIADADIPNLEIPTGVPIVYDLDKDLKVLSKTTL